MIENSFILIYFYQDPTTAVTVAINPEAAKATAIPMTAYSTAFLAVSTFPGFPAEVTNKIPAQTNISVANDATNPTTNLLILPIRAGKVVVGPKGLVRVTPTGSAKTGRATLKEITNTNNNKIFCMLWVIL